MPRGSALSSSTVAPSRRRSAARVDAEPALERLAPVALNIVCFRYVDAAGDLDALNADIVADLQEAGIAAPSTTTLDGRLAIRAAIVNHRTEVADVHALVDGVLAAGRRRSPPVSLRGAQRRSNPPHGIASSLRSSQ